ncbi:hypothetical protein [Streptomyces sp. NBC_00019]|uniref:hypothetical protein n=1 Tax=Streptomyces sp. NBC_00019 TaxID=2975623 RepID=UPI0032485ABD
MADLPVRTGQARTTKIVILDCCFSGIGTRPEHSLAPESTNVIDWTHATGAVTLAASGAYRTAWYEPGSGAIEPQTYFTKYLIDVVEQGLPGYPDGLPLYVIYDRAAHALARGKLPEPTRSVRHEADRFILARNVAAATASPVSLPVWPTSSSSGAEVVRQPTATPTPRAQGAAREAPKTRRGVRRRALVLGTVAAGAAAAGATALLWSDPDSDKFTSQATSAVAFSPDGKTLATIGSDSNDRVGRLWNVASGDAIAGLPAYYGTLRSLAFSPDGITLATGGYSAELRDAATGVVTAKVPDTGTVGSVAFSRDGKTLATSSDGSVRLWNPATRRTTATFQRGVQALALSPDATMLAGGAERYIDSGDDSVGCWLWDVDGKHAVTTLIQESTYAVAFSPDGKTLATGGEGGVRLWDTAARRVATTFTGSPARGVAFSRDGKTVAAAGEGGVRLWDTATRRTTATLSTDNTDAVSVAFSPDGKTVAGGGDGGCWLWKLT